MNVFDLFSGLIPLAVMGLLIYGMVRLARRAHGSHPVDPAVLTRQVATYGLLYVTMIITVIGTIMIADELVSNSVRFDNADLAAALAFVALGLPAFSALLAFADRRLSRDPDEVDSTAWGAYLTVASITALIGTMVGWYQIIESAVDTSRGNDVEFRSVVIAVIWGAFFAVHWVFLRLRHGLRGDVHLAAGSLAGLIPLGIGQAGLLAELVEWFYDNLLDRPTSDLANESANWAALFIVGTAVWLGIWLRQYESSERTQAWYVTVLPIGALVGFVALLATTARLAYLGSVWAIGDTRGLSVGEHFDDVPALVGIGLTGLVSWLYHRSFVNDETTRSNAVRAYDYLLMGASLVSGALGAVIIISSLLDDGSTDQNLALSGVTLLVVGGFTWSRFANHVVSHQVGEDGIDELRSAVRRSYLYATLGIGGFTLLMAGVSALGGVFEDLLDGALASDTIVEQREQLATVIVVGGALWFHALILRNDQQRIAAVAPPPPEPHWPSRIIVMGRDDDTTLDLGTHDNTSIEYWHRTDAEARTAPIALDTLEDALAAQTGDDVLVLLNGDTPTVIPFER